MKKNTLLVLLVIFLFSNKFFGQNTNKDNNYTFKRGDYNGIGKWYMGREIAYVMGFEGIGWLERSEREEEEDVSSTVSLGKNYNMEEKKEPIEEPKEKAHAFDIKRTSEASDKKAIREEKKKEKKEKAPTSIGLYKKIAITFIALTLVLLFVISCDLLAHNLLVDELVVDELA